MSMDSTFKVVPTTEANKMADRDSPDVSNRLEEIISCAVYRLKSGGAILVPFDSSTSAIFSSLEACIAFIAADRIDEIRAGNRFEYIKSEILGIEKSWTHFVSKLSGRLKREVEVTNEKAYLEMLNRDILRYGKRNAERDLYIEIGVYLCAVLKEIVSGAWHLSEQKKNTKYNYFVPIIKDQDGIEYSCWKQLAESFYEHKKFDIIAFLQRGSIYWNIDVTGGEIVKKRAG
jgi:hypothetical protein